MSQFLLEHLNCILRFKIILIEFFFLDVYQIDHFCYILSDYVNIGTTC